MSSDEKSATARLSHSLPVVTTDLRQIGHREWTAMEKCKLKGLAERSVPTEKIARTLRRSAAVTRAMASRLGIRLTDTAPAPSP